MRPESQSISMARCASRYVAPPRTGVPTPGAYCGSTKSISSERWKPVVPSQTMRMASSMTARRPRSSISRMVNAFTPDSRTCGFSSASTSRRPTIATFEACTLGAGPSSVVNSGGPIPMQQASGMPCTLPLGDVSGVFISAWASIQSSPTFCVCLRKCRVTPATVPTPS